MNAGCFHSAYAAGADWSDALEQALRQLPRGATREANLGFVYFSDQFSHAADALLGRLRRATGVDEWIGASAVGVLGNGGAALDAGGISLMVAQLPEDSFRVFSGRRPLARDFVPWAGLVHGDPHTADMAELVQDMTTKLRGDALAGGLASARATALLVAGDVLAGGMSGAVFDEQIQLITGVSQGCVPLPGHWRVTRSRENLIEAIDARSALEVFRQAAGPALGADLRRAVRNLQVGLTDGPEDRRLFAVRRIIGVDVRTGRLALADNIEQGQHILFVRQDDSSARDDLANMLRELRDACPSPPQAGIYVSCLSRGGALFEHDETEIDMIADVFGDMPLTGFFSAGEIVGTRLFGMTGALTLFL
ncbi:MAG: FIST N-terminal domain-containing protein [Rhodocyclaceae bacterium]